MSKGATFFILLMICYDLGLSNSSTIQAQGVTIPAEVFVTIPTNGYMRLTGSDSLTLQSTASGTGSLICNGTFVGPAKVERYMTGAKWHLVSSPVIGQSFSSFINNSANNIPWLSGTNPLQYGIMEYDEVNDKWSTPFTASKSGNFVTSQGYCIRNRTDGKITFKGDLLTSSQTVTLTRGKYGWNCIGNPFTSPIQVKNIGGILADNLTNLDQNYAGIYVWDEQANYNNSGLKKDYRVHCNTPYAFPFDIQENTGTYVAVGQAFFIKSKSGGGTITLSQAMKTHQSGVAFRSTQTNWPALRLQASGNDLVSTTVVAFNEAMTKGLDPSFDVGMLKANAAFSLYSRLVESDGLDYAVQALPDTAESIEIPIGLDCTVASSITFKLEKGLFPNERKIVLEDRENNVFTEFKTDSSSYTTTVASNTKGIGRFYLQVDKNSTSISIPEQAKYLVYANQNRIIVKGNLTEISSISIYTTDGKLIKQYKPENGIVFQTNYLSKGIYFVKIGSKNRQFVYRTML